MFTASAELYSEPHVRLQLWDAHPDWTEAQIRRWVCRYRRLDREFGFCMTGEDLAEMSRAIAWESEAALLVCGESC